MVTTANLKLPEFIPMIATGVIGLVSIYYGKPFNFNHGLQTFEFVPGNEAEFAIRNLFQKETFLLIVVLAILYYVRKNIAFGFLLLGFYVFQAFAFGISRWLESLMRAHKFGGSTVFTMDTFLYVFLPPVTAFVLYYLTVNGDGFLSSLFSSSKKESSLLKEERVLFSMEEFISQNKKVLIRESGIIALLTFSMGLCLLIASFSFNGSIVLSFVAFLVIVGAGLFYFGARSWSVAMALMGFILSSVLILIIVICNFERMQWTQQIHSQIILLYVLNVVVSLAWVIPVFNALLNEEKFVNYIQNRDGSRIRNLLPNYQFQKLDLDQKHLDLYSDELIPWRKRRVVVIIFLTLQVLTCIGFPNFFVTFVYEYQSTTICRILLTANVIVVFTLLLTSILKWGLVMNRVYVTINMIIYGLGGISAILVTMQESLVTWRHLFGVVFNCAVAIVFADLLFKLNKRRRDLKKEISEDSELLDRI